MLKESEKFNCSIDHIDFSDMPSGYNPSDWFEVANKYNSSSDPVTKLLFESEEDIEGFLLAVCYEYSLITSNDIRYFSWGHSKETDDLLIQDISSAVGNSSAINRNMIKLEYMWSGENKVSFEGKKIIISLGVSVCAAYKEERDDVIQASAKRILNGCKVTRKVTESYTTDWFPATPAGIVISWKKVVNKVYKFDRLNKNNLL
jgi:hypothetical protein